MKEGANSMLMKFANANVCGVENVIIQETYRGKDSQIQTNNFKGNIEKWDLKAGCAWAIWEKKFMGRQFDDVTY